jgi:hypothetical protein
MAVVDTQVVTVGYTTHFGVLASRGFAAPDFYGSNVGSCSDGTSNVFGGATIKQFYHLWADPAIGGNGSVKDFIFEVAGSQSNSGFDNITINGNVYTRSNATYTSNSTSTKWQWAQVAQPFSSAGSTDSVQFSSVNNYDFSLSYLTEGNGQILVIGQNTTAANPLQLLPKDKITFTRGAEGSGTTITVAGFNGSYWTSTSNVTSTNTNDSTVKTVKDSPSFGSFSLTVSASTAADKTIYVEVVNSVQSTPDSFTGDLGADVTIAPSVSIGSGSESWAYFAPVTITGINTTITATASDDELGANLPQVAFQSGNSADRTFETSKDNVVNNDVLVTRIAAPEDYSDNVAFTLTVGGMTDTANVITPNDPETGAEVAFGVTSGEISMLDLINFFGGQSQSYWDWTFADGTRPNSMSDFYRSGSFVPNITANQTCGTGGTGIPTSGQIQLDDFYSCKTSFYFASLPRSKIISVDTSTGVGWPIGAEDSQGNPTYTITLLWTTDPDAIGGTDFAIGFGDGMRYNSEYKYSVSHSTNNPSTVTFAGASSYGISNFSCAVSATVTGTVEEWNQGTITIYARKYGSNNPSIEKTATMSYALNFFGP